MYLECGFLASEEHTAGSRHSGYWDNDCCPCLDCSCSVSWRGRNMLNFRFWEISVTQPKMRSVPCSVIRKLFFFFLTSFLKKSSSPCILCLVSVWPKQPGVGVPPQLFSSYVVGISQGVVERPHIPARTITFANPMVWTFLSTLYFSCIQGASCRQHSEIAGLLCDASLFRSTFLLSWKW